MNPSSRDYAGKTYLERPPRNSACDWCITAALLVLGAAVWLSPLWLG